MGRKKSNSVLTPLKQIYPQDVCDAMDALVSTPFIPLQPMSDASCQVLAGLHFEWYIAAYWIANEFKATADRNRYPFNTPRFRKQESWGRMLYSLHRLCQGCERFGKLPEMNSWDFWLQCLLEAKRNHVDFVFGPIAENRVETFIKVKRYFLADLKDGRLPALDGLPHLRKLLKEAQRLRTTLKSAARKSFCQEYWNPFLSTYQGFIKKTSPDLASGLPFYENGELKIQGTRYPRNIPLPKEKPETEGLEKPISIQVSEKSFVISFVLWSEHSAYPRNAISTITYKA